MRNENIDVTGSYYSIRFGILRNDYDTDAHGTELSFYSHDCDLFQTKEGTVIPDDDRDTAVIDLIGWDEMDGDDGGYAISVTAYPVKSSSVRLEDDSDKLFSEINKFIRQYITDDEKVADAVCKIISTSWGFDGDPDEIQEEALDNLEGVEYQIEFYGAETLDMEDNSFAGGVFFELNSFSDVPCKLGADGTMEFGDDIDLDEYRNEDQRFVCVVKASA